MSSVFVVLIISFILKFTFHVNLCQKYVISLQHFGMIMSYVAFMAGGLSKCCVSSLFYVNKNNYSECTMAANMQQQPDLITLMQYLIGERDASARIVDGSNLLFYLIFEACICALLWCIKGNGFDPDSFSLLQWTCTVFFLPLIV